MANVTRLLGQGLSAALASMIAPLARLQTRKPARMVDMGMAVEQIFHGARVKTQRLDVANDLRRGLRHHAVDQDMAFGIW
jgi:hypothetical protein